MTGQLYSPVDGAPIPPDKATPGYVSAQDVIDRLVLDLVRATGAPESSIRLGAGLAPAGCKPRYPAIPAPDPEACP